MTLLPLEAFYALAGVLLFTVSARALREPEHPRRIGSALFWSLLGTCFLFGRLLPSLVAGVLVIAMILLAAAKQVAPPRLEPSTANRSAEAERLGDRVFGPALVIPAVAALGSFLLPRIRVGTLRVVDPAQATLVSLALGAILALVFALRLTGASPRAPIVRGGKLIELVGWSLLLPQALAALGGLLSRAGLGRAIAEQLGRVLPTGDPRVAVVAYCLGMWLFTICLGNAFAAFAVVTSGVGLPLIVRAHGGDPAIMAALGMLSGYCGTLMTPMAANFNLVPALLLELRDQRAVLKAQIPVGATLLVFNMILMALVVFP